MDVDTAITEAAKKLGYQEVKSEQRDVIRQFVSGRDVFVSLPTGFGKSLCYVLLPLVSFYDAVRGRPQSIVLCISPLVSLMVNQKEKFASKGLAVEYVGSGVEAHDRIMQGQCQLVYISPEALLCNLYWREILRSEVWQLNLVALVVDEAHCVQKWLVIYNMHSAGNFVYNICAAFYRGDHFRHAYGRIGEI